MRGIAAERRRERLPPAFALSLLAHALILAVLLRGRPTEAPQWLPPPSFDMVFEGGSKEKPSVAAPSPGAGGAAPTSPASGRGDVSASPPAAAPSTPASPASPPAGASSTAASPASRERSARLGAAGEGAPPRFPAPMAFSLGTPGIAPSRPARGIDLSFGSGVGGGDETRVVGLSVVKAAGPDWANRFAAWWIRHRYYPPEAGENGQQGDVVVDFIVRRDGLVQALTLSARSGSPFLDLATLAILRDAHLPPLPSDAPAPVRLTVRYRIIH